MKSQEPINTGKRGNTRGKKGSRNKRVLKQAEKYEYPGLE